MRVFVTGASGFVGSVVVSELLSHGHEVLGLARSDEAAAAVTRAGAQVQRGELTDTDSLVAGARACYGVILHRKDAAALYRLALEKAPAGTRLHAVAEEGVPTRAIAETIGAGLKLPVRSLTPEQAPAFFEFLAAFVGLDIRASSARAREAFGWRPKEIDLISDMRETYSRRRRGRLNTSYTDDP